MDRDSDGLKAILALIVLVVSLLCWRGCHGYYQQHTTGTFKCVKTYTVTSGDGDSGVSTSKRVDLLADNGQVTTMECNDSFLTGTWNSASLYAQFEPGVRYEVTYTGYRREGFIHWFPIITGVRRLAN